MPRPRLGARPMEPADKSKRRADQFRRMKAHHRAIRDEARTLEEAKALAAAALSTDGLFVPGDAKGE